MTGPEQSIVARNLRKAYGPFVAVDDLSLSVEAGETFGFLGPNGAGKTTTVKMLLGLVTPTAGEARVLGRPPSDWRARARVGFLPEHFRFPSWLTADELLHMHARLYRMPAADAARKVPALLERVGLGGRGRDRLGDFSKGMSQRIGLAQALLNDPAVVFLDEPTSGLDPLGRRLVRDIIRALAADGVAVFLNSHLLSEVEHTCDRVAIVNRGRVVHTGTLDDLPGMRSTVEIEAGGLTPGIVEALGADRVASHEGGRLVLASVDRAAVADVVQRLVDAGAEVYRVEHSRPTLEDLFVRVVESDGDGS